MSYAGIVRVVLTQAVVDKTTTRATSFTCHVYYTTAPSPRAASGSERHSEYFADPRAPRRHPVDDFRV
jgi:hypothetical protein